MALNLFNGGYLPLGQRCLAETLYWAICAKLRSSCRRWTKCPRTCRASTTRWPTRTSATSRCSSRFPTRGPSSSSFPIMPIHRLNETPTRARRPRRHHLRFGRQDRPVHRPPRRQAHARAAHVQRRAVLHRRRSSSARIRKSSATCTTSSATPTPCTCSLDRDGQRDPRRRHQGRYRPRSARLRPVRRRACSSGRAATSRPPSATAG